MSAPVRVVFGTATAADERLTAELLDQFYDAGGRAIDLANAYADGASERAVGAWLRARRRGDDMLLFAKGCHPPRCDAALVASEVETALRSLGTDSLDPFILHRDDPTIAIDTWADVLAAELQRGTVRSVGVSNWTVERFRELQESLSGAGSVTVFSNHFSLAEMAEAPWPGCLAIDADGTRALAGSGVTVLAWASLAHGYLGNGSSADRPVWRSWATPANDARRARAHDLAAGLGVAPATIAVAYVLAHEGVRPVVGTRSETHLAEVLAAEDVLLTSEQVGQLETGG